MNTKLALLNAYYYGSLPARVLRNARLAAAGRAPVMILFYHRIADDAANPWTTSTAAFRRQIDWLARHFDLVSLAEAQRIVARGYNPHPVVSITFDDGYADNCDMALPWLVERGIPCTYFVSTQPMLEGRPFLHDVARRCPLSPNTPSQIREMAQAGIDIGAHTRTHADLAKIRNPKRLRDELVVARDELQEITGQAVRYFSFPFGLHANLDDDAFRLARDLYDGVCSAYGGYNFPGDDPSHLQRIGVDDELIRIKNWVTLDPRKLRSIERYELHGEEVHRESEPGESELDLAGVGA